MGSFGRFLGTLRVEPYLRMEPTRKGRGTKRERERKKKRELDTEENWQKDRENLVRTIWVLKLCLKPNLLTWTFIWANTSPLQLFSSPFMLAFQFLTTNSCVANTHHNTLNKVSICIREIGSGKWSGERGIYIKSTEVTKNCMKHRKRSSMKVLVYK